MARIDASAKISGEGKYTADINPPGCCYVGLVTSPFPHARVIAIDVTDALAVPGVVGVYTAKDFPRRLIGRKVFDIPVLAQEEVRYVGERVAAVVAESRDIAERAASRVQVEYEALPTVFDAQEALTQEAPLVHEEAWKFAGAVVAENDHNLQSEVVHETGDVEAALTASDFVIDHVYETPAGHQGYLEPQACVAQVAPDGKFDIWAANKSPYRLREQVGGYLGREATDINVHPVLIGGDFGGKGGPLDVPLVARLAELTGRPVKLVRRYAEDLIGVNPRHATRLRIRLGCDREGRLTGLAADAWITGGAYAGYKPLANVGLHGMEEIGGAYRLPALKVDARIAYTHSVPGGHMRSPGSPQAIFALESAMDELAAAAGIDPVEFRRKNLLDTGEANPYHQVWVEARGKQTLDAAESAYRPLPVPPGWVHGRGVGVYNRSTGSGNTSMRIIPQENGRLTLEIGFPEVGTGAHTVVRNGLAQALDIDPSLIHVVHVATSGLPNDDGVGGSRVTAELSQAVARVAQAFIEAGRNREVTVEALAERDRKVTSYSVQIAQVAVDPESGQVKVLEILSAVDVATVINERAHQLQIDGAAAMGYGFACMEDLAMTEGKVGAANLGDFKIPSERDVPKWSTVLVTGGQGIGALNVKGIAELANVPTAAAIANAVNDAVGVRIRQLPISAEAVFRALHQAGEKEEMACG